MKNTLKKAVAQAAEEAAGLLPDLRIELCGSREAVVDGCRGIIEYTESCIRLGGARQIVRFTGSGLVMRCFEDGGAVISGRISAVELS